MKYVQLANSKKRFKVSDQDYERVAGLNWSLTSEGRVISSIGGKIIHVTRFILGVNDPKMLVDHENGDLLDEQRENLRPCTRLENNRNRVGWKNSSSKHNGVGYHKQGRFWVARIMDIYLGSFSTEEAAAKAYNEAALKYFGKFAKLNKI